MINGIEARVPFLDKDLSEYLFYLNNDYKIKNGISRWIFKEYVKKNIYSKFLTKSKKSVVDPGLRKRSQDFFDNFNSSEFKSQIILIIKK